jgi:hypothetical protein
MILRGLLSETVFLHIRVHVMGLLSNNLFKLTPSSSEMQEVALRKQELLRRLRKVRGFEDVVDVRFSVNG